jgi:phosphoserine aminotransferase
VHDANNTIHGTEWQYLTGAAPLVRDMSSDIPRPIDVKKYEDYAGAQKNGAVRRHRRRVREDLLARRRTRRRRC